MKNTFKISFSLIVLAIFTVLFTGCADISKSKNYRTYEIKYLANLSNVSEENQEQKLDELQKVLKGRLNNFNVNNVSINQISENDNEYLTLSFGTIDDIQEIKQKLLQDNRFIMKKSVANNYDNEQEEPVDQTKLTDEKTQYAENILQQLLDGNNFNIIAQNEALNSPENVVYSTSEWMYKDEIKDVFSEKLDEMENGEIYPELITYNDGGGLRPLVEVAGILKLFEKEEVERVTEIPKTVEVSHILITFNEETRTKEEAETLVNEILERLNNDEDFATLAIEYSEDPTNSPDGGKLPTPAGVGVYVEPFENAALALEEDGQLSKPVETQFGLHIIKADKVNPADEDVTVENRYKFGVIFYASVLPKWKNTELNDEFIKDVELRYDETYNPYFIIAFDNEGKEMLKEITTSNQGNVIGMFIGNTLISSFTVKETNETGKIKIETPETSQQADQIKELLVSPKLPVPILMINDKETNSNQEEE